MNKVLILVTTIVISSAVLLNHEDEAPQFPATNQEYCDDNFRSTDFYRYTFNQMACACFFEFISFAPCHTSEEPRINPFHEIGNRYDLCISEDDY